jgi:hypothetical protein
VKQNGSAKIDSTLRRQPRALLEAAFDTRHPDILIITYTDLVDEDRQIACVLAEKHLNAFKRPFAVVMDMRALTNMPPTQRAMYAAAREAVRQNYIRHHVLTVYVLHDSAQRGVLTAIGWIARAETSSGRVFVSTVAEALQHCQSALSARRGGP